MCDFWEKNDKTWNELDFDFVLLQSLHLLTGDNQLWQYFWVYAVQCAFEQ